MSLLVSLISMLVLGLEEVCVKLAAVCSSVIGFQVESVGTDLRKEIDLWLLQAKLTSLKDFVMDSLFLVSLFNDISTFITYLMPKPFF